MTHDWGPCIAVEEWHWCGGRLPFQHAIQTRFFQFNDRNDSVQITFLNAESWFMAP